MGDQEIAYSIMFVGGDAVVFIDRHSVETAAREIVDEPYRRGLNQLDARRLKRLHEAGGEPHRDAVLVPHLLATARGESQKSRFTDRLAVEVLEQRVGRFI